MSNIEWTDETWNPTRGCQRISEGCRNCYAEKTGARFCGPGQPYEGLVRIGDSGPRWTGEGLFVPDALDKPLRWRKPRMIFVDSMSDLFFEKFTNEQIARVFSVMRQAKQHTFQVLTKRADRMLEWVTDYVRGSFPSVGGGQPLPPNILLGVSVENQAAADERGPLLLRTPAAVRFLSVEPLLGPVDLRHLFPRPMFHCSRCGKEKMRSYCAPCGTGDNTATNEIIGIDWVIVGGESGPGARPCDVSWIRGVVEQCKTAGAPVFVKQLGARPVEDDTDAPAPTIRLRDRKGGDPSEWPEDLKVRQFPEVPR